MKALKVNARLEIDSRFTLTNLLSKLVKFKNKTCNGCVSSHSVGFESCIILHKLSVLTPKTKHFLIRIPLTGLFPRRHLKKKTEMNNNLITDVTCSFACMSNIIKFVKY